MNIQEKLATIQTKFKSKKSRYNSFGKYYFRSAEDILEAIKPYLLDLRVTVYVREELITDQEFPIIRTIARISDIEPTGSGNCQNIEASAIVGVDLAQKGMQMPQKFGSASSYGKKYALGNLFLIDDTQDSDAANTHGKESKPKVKPELKGAALTKARAAIKDGKFTVEDIQKKYAIPAAILKTL